LKSDPPPDLLEIFTYRRDERKLIRKAGE